MYSTFITDNLSLTHHHAEQLFAGESMLRDLWKSSNRLPNSPCLPPWVWHPETSAIIRTRGGSLTTQHLLFKGRLDNTEERSGKRWHKAADQWAPAGVLIPDKLVACFLGSGTQSVRCSLVLALGGYAVQLNRNKIVWDRALMQQHNAADINDSENTTRACLIPSSQGFLKINLRNLILGWINDNIIKLNSRSSAWLQMINETDEKFMYYWIKTIFIKTTFVKTTFQNRR